MSGWVKFQMPKDLDVLIPHDAANDVANLVWANIEAQGFRHVWTDCGTEYFDHADGSKAYISFGAAL